MTTAPGNLSLEIAALKAALAAERTARQQAEARASSAEALIAYYKLQIAKLKREQYGQSSERGGKLLDQLELQLEEAAASAAEDELAAPIDGTTVRPFTRKKPVRAAFPAHLPRERVGDPRPDRLSLLRRQARQARRNCHRDAGGGAAAMEGHPDRAREDPMGDWIATGALSEG